MLFYILSLYFIFKSFVIIEVKNHFKIISSIAEEVIGMSCGLDRSL
jgi:hypothetical protein